jgi:hypothetical protein
MPEESDDPQRQTRRALRALADENRRDLDQYDPDRGLKVIAAASAAEKVAKKQLRNKPGDPFLRQQLRDVIKRKITEQADYVVWRGRVVTPSQRDPRLRGKRDAGITELKSPLPDFDPGDVTISRWGKKLCIKVDGRWQPDDDKRASVYEDSSHRSIRICEAEKDGTIRGTEGTGEFERYTPAKYIEAARLVLGEIDLDPATSKMAQKTVRATEYYTAANSGLKHEWHGRIWLNPPYHRELAPLFINKLVQEVEAGHVEQAIMLTNNCTDTDWFDVALRACQSICFSHGRIKFTTEKSGEVLPTQGQAFFYFGLDAQRFEDVFCLIGPCLRPSRQYELPHPESSESCEMESFGGPDES